MSERQVTNSLLNLQQACVHLTDFAAGRSRAEYESDALLRSAVEMQFTYAGRAIELALQSDPGVANHLSQPHVLVALRDDLVHRYAAIDNDKVWSILQTGLPLLRQEVDALLNQP